MKSRVDGVAHATPWLAACGSEVDVTPGTPVPPFVQVASPVSGASLDEPVVRLSGQVSAPGALAKLTARVDGGEARGGRVGPDAQREHLHGGAHTRRR
ncbi:hypothetical protein [Myxococcus stipitatus]|uniref:hypothetical protein n=1 Tax=Myxococcus stipitatus TaxID=83455 RepID=UPI0030D5B251